MKTIIVGGAGKSESRVLDIIKDKIKSSNNKYTAPQATPKSCSGCKHGMYCANCGARA